MQHTGRKRGAAHNESDALEQGRRQIDCLVAILYAHTSIEMRQYIRQKLRNLAYPREITITATR